MPLPHFFHVAFCWWNQAVSFDPHSIHPLLFVALWSLSIVKSCLLRSSSPWSVSLLKTKLVPLKANALNTAPPIVNNNDAIYFLPKMISNQSNPTIKSAMTSFSLLFFSVSIFRLSCRAAVIIILGISSSGWVMGNFLWSLFISCLCYSPKFFCCILLSSLCLSLNRLEACMCLCPLKNLPLIMHIQTSADTSQYRCQ